MPTVEGLTPSVLWTTVYGFLALCLLFIIVYRVYDAIHTIIERRKKAKEAEKPDFVEQVSQQVSQKIMEKLEPRFNEIEKNLGTEKYRLDDHESIIAGIRRNQKETRDGLVAICKYLMAMAQYGSAGGNSKEMMDATSEMTQYLATKIGGTAFSVDRD